MFIHRDLELTSRNEWETGSTKEEAPASMNNLCWFNTPCSAPCGDLSIPCNPTVTSLLIGKGSMWIMGVGAADSVCLTLKVDSKQRLRWEVCPHSLIPRRSGNSCTRKQWHQSDEAPKRPVAT